MMRTAHSLLVISLIASSSITSAARLRIEREPGTNVYSYFLDGEEENGLFDTIVVSVSPALGSSFTNLDPDGVDGFTPRLPGDESTYINAYLDAPSGFGGNGFTVLGRSVTSGGVEFTAGPLGGTIDTVSGVNVGANGLFLVNVLVEGNAGISRVQLVSQGAVIEDIWRIPIIPHNPLPEPASLTLAGIGVLGMLRRLRA